MDENRKGVKVTGFAVRGSHAALAAHSSKKRAPNPCEMWVPSFGRVWLPKDDQTGHWKELIFL